MGKTKKEELWEDIEIVCVGKLFTGPWENKYWSSSRGKERYPYPVGYKSVRTQNGVRYTMEILQGLKGPSFMISSCSSSDDDENKCCYGHGDTPNLAWEIFQKKLYSKLYMSLLILFKNTTFTPQSSCKFTHCFFMAICFLIITTLFLSIYLQLFGLKNRFVQKLLRELVVNVGGTAEQVSNLSSECTPSSGSSHAKEKRKRKDKLATSTQLSKTRVNQQQKCTNNVSSSSTFADADQVDITNHLKLGCSLSHPENEPSDDRSRYGEDRGVFSNSHIDLLPVVNGDDLCAPDSFDQAGGDEIVNGVDESEFFVTDSAPQEDEIGISTCSEKCDTDLFGQELDNSMMTVLLPRAVPLLKKSLFRKKCKSAKSSKNPIHGSQNNEMDDEPRSNIQQKVKLNNKPDANFKLFGCYVHPMPISLVQLIVKDNEIFIFVKCGYSCHNESNLFLHKALLNGEKMGCPSLIGHAPIALQISNDLLGRDIVVGRSMLQLTPDAQSVVLLNNIKTPCCREGKLDCPCWDCTSDIYERNAVKIVRLKRGYASVVTKLKTAKDVCCLLVCEPSFLLAAEEDGNLKLWVMNYAWSGQKDEWHLPTFDWIVPSIIELKTIPKSASLVVGHNGFGEFGLWDIYKGNLVSKFSCLGLSVSECVPVSVFRWQRKTDSIVNDIIIDPMNKSFSSAVSKNSDVAVWLLISTPPDPFSLETNPVACWSLALLVNNLVITGTVIDGCMAAAVTSAGYGVVGGNDGIVYLWELCTGEKLGNVHSFKGSQVSYITTDTSESGALAIASADQLRVYLPS
ncbi:hypothetical protein MIMGU_mgv1a025251mg [Erythranthe guttata]|uniref:Uncharacterized protein n=1 Tax=Erythranthe guttata TaxID=4155 RepID=A0A022Q1I0_ERYGU|nr:hypothetical protein MIMGU_mgv1a025251mg [Erythranthe guttata]